MDATRVFGTIGRLINHGRQKREVNLKAMSAVVDGIIRLGFLASRDIKPGEELLYDYGWQEGGPDWLKTKSRNTVEEKEDIEDKDEDRQVGKSIYSHDYVAIYDFLRFALAISCP